MRNSKNNKAWIQIFEQYDVLDRIENEGYFIISSQKINDYREARLMTKFDHRSQLPEIFSKHKLSILPIARGEYFIAQIETFLEFDDNEVSVEIIHFPISIESLDYKNITSEATAINCAIISRIFEKFTGEAQDLFHTISGRMSSSAFDFTISGNKKTHDISVENAQIEIDAGFESENAIYLIEAKNHISKDFLIRQLYYPFRLWNEKVSKPVKPIFLTYSNGIFHLREYRFDKANEYNSLKLVKQKKYMIREGDITLELIRSLVSNTSIQPEPEISFPQADSFERIINLCELLIAEECLSHEAIQSAYDFNKRQVNYYTDAGRYLGLIEKFKDLGLINFKLTKEGKSLFEKDFFGRQIALVEAVLEHQIFKTALSLYFTEGQMPTINQIATLMKLHGAYQVNADSTFKRRARTVQSWLTWIIRLTEYRLF